MDNINNSQLPIVLEKIKASDYTYCAFISPSGQGIKVFCFINTDKELHEVAFNQLKKYYENLTGVKIDPSGKDVARLCYVSFDPNAYFNEGSRVFEVEIQHAVNSGKHGGKSSEAYEQCKEIASKNNEYVEGNRNNFIYILANLCNKAGIEADLAFEYLTADFDLDPAEIKTSIKSAYNNKSEHNTLDVKTKKTLIDKVENYLNERYEFRFNVVTGKVEYKSIDSKKFKSITDYVELSMLREIQKAKIKCNQTTLRNILGSDFCEVYNPFHEYLNSLEIWDNSTDYINELAKTIKTTNDDFWANCLKKWLVALVGSLLDDKTVNQTVIVFSGKQGLGKTTWLENLVPMQLSDYVFSGTINPNNKDTLIHLSECMIINLDELENLSKSEIGALKEIITKSIIRIRKAYGHNNETLIRRASFVGSVNSSQFLNDTTGSRRFLCFEVLEIEYKHQIDLSKVLAQALFLYKDNFKYWFDKNEIEQINQNNEQYQLKSIEEELLITWFEIPKEKAQTSYLSTSQIASKLAQFSKLQVTNATLNHLGKALKKLGFNRVKKNSIWVYEVKELSFDDVEKESKKLE